MKITKSQLKQIIKEELFCEGQGSVGNFGGVAGSLANVHPAASPQEDTPDSVIQRQALEFFTTLELTSKVVKVLVRTIAIPDLIELMDKIPKIDTAAEEDII
tara:strand:- start:188 stop:493 length:306 start_codon:yes stop_codon:yes gene_type:complete